MKTGNVTITNKLGIHARPAAKISAIANDFTASISITYGDKNIDAKSIMQVMMLAAGHGQVLTISVDGPDENEALAAITALIETGFDEE